MVSSTIGHYLSMLDEGTCMGAIVVKVRCVQCNGKRKQISSFASTIEAHHGVYI